jgi:hypothetical protein
MENNNEKEDFEDCIEEKQEVKQQSENTQPQNETKENEDSNQEKNENNIKEDEKEKQNDNKSDEENENNDKENKKEKYIPYTIKQAQEKEKEKENDDYSFPEKDEKDSDKEEDHEPEKEEKLTEEEKKDIEEKIINERKNAGDLYKNKEYIQALNTYSLLLTDAKRADLKEQCCILNCNKGICFNKLYEYDKALDCFKEALKYNKDYSKALCNKMLILHKKEEYLEAYEDFKRLKTLDYNLWENYRNMENELAYKAEIQKKKMTDEMLGKLKDVGNTILGKFGLSLNNFKMTPNGQGGYSIQYNNNK